MASKADYTHGLLFLAGILALYGSLVLVLPDTRVGTSTISTTLILIGALWIVFDARRENALQLVVGAPPRWQSTLVFFIVAFVLTRLAGYGFTAAFPAQAAALRHDVVSWPFLAFYFLVSIPLQEFIFRGYVLTVLRQWFGGSWSAIIASSFLYAFFHLHYSWQLALAIFPLGMLFAVVKFRTHSLVYATITHAIIALVFYYML